ncbi:hypothetical protein ES708_12038 [subsurface metagenome]
MQARRPGYGKILKQQTLDSIQHQPSIRIHRTLDENTPIFCSGLVLGVDLSYHLPGKPGLLPVFLPSPRFRDCTQISRDDLENPGCFLGSYQIGEQRTAVWFNQDLLLLFNGQERFLHGLHGVLRTGFVSAGNNQIEAKQLLLSGVQNIVDTKDELQGASGIQTVFLTEQIQKVSLPLVHPFISIQRFEGGKLAMNSSDKFLVNSLQLFIIVDGNQQIQH